MPSAMPDTVFRAVDELRDASRKSRRIRFSVRGCAPLRGERGREGEGRTQTEERKREAEVIKADRTRKKPAPFSLLPLCLHPFCFYSPLSFPLPSVSLPPDPLELPVSASTFRLDDKDAKRLRNSSYGY